MLMQLAVNQIFHLQKFNLLPHHVTRIVASCQLCAYKDMGKERGVGV